MRFYGVTMVATTVLSGDVMCSVCRYFVWVVHDHQESCKYFVSCICNCRKKLSQ